MGELIINSKEAKDIAVILYEKFNSKEGIFGHNIMPEDFLPCWGSDLSASNIEKGSHEHLMFIALVVSIDYQRDADQLWEAGRRTFEDEGTRWLFFPTELVKRDFNEVVKAMKVHKLSKKPQKDAGIWFRVSRSIFELHGSNPLNIIKECNYDALEVFNKKFDLRFKKQFPYLSGDKIFPLWIRMLHDNAGVELKNLDKIPIPVDVHVARATFTTGCLTGKYKGTISKISPKIDEAWNKAIELVRHPKLTYRLQLDEPLWHLSRYGCTFRDGNFCPKRRACPVREFCAKGLVDISAERVNVNTSPNLNEGDGEFES
jgi:hypothetical protein